ncbi:hypothetical protein QTP88_003851 [Uroleucon formosanum]
MHMSFKAIRLKYSKPIYEREIAVALTKIKLSGNVLEASKYRETDIWEEIKSILKGVFEHRASEIILTIKLNCAQMIEKQALIVFINGLPKHLKLVLKARDPTLEEAMQMAKDEEIEHNSKVKIENLQNKVEQQDFDIEVSRGG